MGLEIEREIKTSFLKKAEDKNFHIFAPYLAYLIPRIDTF